MSNSDGNSQESTIFKWNLVIKDNVDEVEEQDEETQLPEEGDTEQEKEAGALEDIFEQIDAYKFCAEFLPLQPEDLSDEFLSFLVDSGALLPEPERFVIPDLQPRPLPSHESAIISTTTQPSSQPIPLPLVSYLPVVSTTMNSASINTQPNVPKTMAAVLPFELPFPMSQPASSMNTAKTQPTAKIPKKRKANDKKKKEAVQHCRDGGCNLPPSALMISCDTCGLWVHAQCQGIDSEEATQLSEFICRACRTEEKLRRKEKRKEKKRLKKEKKELKKKWKAFKKRHRQEAEERQHKKSKTEADFTKSLKKPQRTPRCDKICFDCKAAGYDPSVYLHLRTARFCRRCRTKSPSVEEQRRIMRQNSVPINN